ncbi:CotY/CotZ family spore coat protein [Pseudalkalibacillus caeni]|uniref:Spore coat protein n=1 Tax=Exobacillus caeni TaxID=2574798 RepID=A0A5R9F1N2_9BACL|nr:CotY/CotZ family spore coat protein [Pseudalkalibacillus caeni]TLS35358.1 spore coat protein [Pseudalkalibacillus caeni]
MSCKHGHGECVCDVVREIDDVQRKVQGSECNVSCERSIQELIKGNYPTKDTIPFKLIGESGDEFKAKAPVKVHANHDFCIAFVRSSYFRVEKFVKEKECCAILELLCPIKSGYKITGFQRTGACITVDLDCFCSIICLPAVKAEKVYDPADLTCLVSEC